MSVVGLIGLVGTVNLSACLSVLENGVTYMKVHRDYMH